MLLRRIVGAYGGWGVKGRRSKSEAGGQKSEQDSGSRLALGQGQAEEVGDRKWKMESRVVSSNISVKSIDPNVRGLRRPSVLECRSRPLSQWLRRGQPTIVDHLRCPNAFRKFDPPAPKQRQSARRRRRL